MGERSSPMLVLNYHIQDEIAKGGKQYHIDLLGDAWYRCTFDYSSGTCKCSCQKNRRVTTDPCCHQKYIVDNLLDWPPTVSRSTERFWQMGQTMVLRYRKKCLAKSMEFWKKSFATLMGYDDSFLNKATLTG